ncbi:MAG: uroporphyrinogen decarboxylase (URO-D) [Parasporobacterium sp.]|nr:uroporphyrinogen decarboxylase (URO-D) [Parasporobacterium sp.]
MLTPKQNFYETLKKDGHPDRLVNQYNSMVFFMQDPLGQFTRGNRIKGKTTLDRWGVRIMWPEDQIAAIPDTSDEVKVCKDVCEWERYVKVPDLAAACDDDRLWKETLEQADRIDRDQFLVTGFMPDGVFEQMHNLMGFEDTLMNFLLEPEATLALAQAIGEYKFQYARILVDHLKPDVIISLDDWGSNNSMFMSPDIWREFIMPQYVPVYEYLHEHHVTVIHHSDSYLEPIVEDMVELGIDVWQGILPTNPINQIITQLDGRMTVMGGIDSIVDRVDATEEEIRAEALRACREYSGRGFFIPSITYGSPKTAYPHVYDIITDAIDGYNREVFGD